MRLNIEESALFSNECFECFSGLLSSEAMSQISAHGYQRALPLPVGIQIMFGQLASFKLIEPIRYRGHLALECLTTGLQFGSFATGKAENPAIGRYRSMQSSDLIALGVAVRSGREATSYIVNRF